MDASTDISTTQTSQMQTNHSQPPSRTQAKITAESSIDAISELIEEMMEDDSPVQSTQKELQQEATL